MSTAAQLLANQASSQPSTGRFSATGFIRPGEAGTFSDFSADWSAELSPATPLEHTLATEIIRAAWRLRRCAELESTVPEDTGNLDLDRLQTSIDRARAAAQRSLHRSLAELRRTQTERVYRQIALPAGFDSETLGQAGCRDLDPPALLIRQVQAEDARLRQLTLESHTAAPAKQTQSAPVSVARNAQCPCGSGDKYKRCCGRNAPPVLRTA